MSLALSFVKAVLRCVAWLAMLAVYTLFWATVALGLIDFSKSRFCPSTLQRVLNDGENVLLISCLVATTVSLVLMYVVTRLLHHGARRDDGNGRAT